MSSSYTSAGPASCACEAHAQESLNVAGSCEARRTKILMEKQRAILELDDIQAPVLRPRPMPYHGAYFVVRIDDPAHGRAMLGRLAPRVASAAGPHGSADS